MHWELLSFKTHLYNQSLTGFQKSYNNKNFNRSKANLPSTRFKFQWKLSPRKVCCRPFVLQRKHMVSTEHQLKVWEKHQLSTITADKNLGCVLPSLVHHSCVEFGRQARLGLTLVDIWVSDLNLETSYCTYWGEEVNKPHILTMLYSVREVYRAEHFYWGNTAVFSKRSHIVGADTAWNDTIAKWQTKITVIVCHTHGHAEHEDFPFP